MYSNIGSKIKSLAKWTFIIEAIAAVISAIALMVSDDDFVLIGFLIMIAGPIVAWVSSWMVYGFGELIDKTCEIARNTRGGEIKSEAQFKLEDARINKIEKLREKELITEEEYKQIIPAVLANNSKNDYSDRMSPDRELEILNDELTYETITEQEYNVKRAEIISRLDQI